MVASPPAERPPGTRGRARPSGVRFAAKVVAGGVPRSVTTSAMAPAAAVSTSARSSPAAIRMRRSSSAGAGWPRPWALTDGRRVEVGDDEEGLPVSESPEGREATSLPLRRRNRPSPRAWATRSG